MYDMILLTDRNVTLQLLNIGTEQIGIHYKYTSDISSLSLTDGGTKHIMWQIFV
jgi:hypothetical protein